MAWKNINVVKGATVLAENHESGTIVTDNWSEGIFENANSNYTGDFGASTPVTGWGDYCYQVVVDRTDATSITHYVGHNLQSIEVSSFKLSFDFIITRADQIQDTGLSSFVNMSRTEAGTSKSFFTMFLTGDSDNPIEFIIQNIPNSSYTFAGEINTLYSFEYTWNTDLKTYDLTINNDSKISGALPTDLENYVPRNIFYGTIQIGASNSNASFTIAMDNFKLQSLSGTVWIDDTTSYSP